MENNKIYVSDRIEISDRSMINFTHGNIKFPGTELDFYQCCINSIQDAKDKGFKECIVPIENVSNIDKDIMDIFNQGYTIRLLRNENKVQIQWR